MTVQTGGDASFTEYVALRWSMLYRLASLLVGPGQAEDLARAGLVRAYLVWPEIQESAALDDQVKRILAGVAAKTPHTAVGPGDDSGTVTARERLWAEIGALLPAQRVMLVLRHYEGLSDAEIAGALRCATSTVAAELLALETGIHLGELREEMFLRSERAQVPHPPIATLLAAAHGARRDRRRRAWSWASGLAAMLALGLVVAYLAENASGHSGTARPVAADHAARFLSMLPEGQPPRLAYSEGRSLHLGSGGVIELPDLPTRVVQTKKWLFVADVSGRIVRIDPIAGDTHTVADSSYGQLVTDPQGEHVAWLASGGGPAVVVVRTVWDWAVARSDEQSFPATPRCCDNPFVVVGMTGLGQVVGSLPAAQETWVWHTPDGGDPHPVVQLSGLGEGEVSEVVAIGVVVHHPPSLYLVGDLHKGQFVRTSSVIAKQAEFADPLGRRVILVDEDGEIHVRDIRLRGRSRRVSQDVRLSLPATVAGFTAARWEDGAHVLLDVADPSLPRGALVRCDVDTGLCELTVRFDGPHLLAD